MKQSDNSKKLRFGEKIAYGLGDCSANIYVALGGTFLMGYYTDTVGIAAAAIATMMLTGRIFDGFTDLAMGVVVDKTHSRFGKARPWILWTAPLMGLGLMAMFMVPSGLGASGKLIYAYISYIIMNCIIYTANNLPYNALLSRMTLDVQDRIDTSALRFIMTQTTTLIVNIATTKLLPTLGWTKLIIVYGIIEIIMLVICFAGCREHIGENEADGMVKVDKVPIKQGLIAMSRNKYFYFQIALFCLTLMLLCSSGMMGFYFSSYILNDFQFLSIISIANTVPIIVLNFFIPKFVSKIGKRKLMIIGCCFIILGSSIIGFADVNRVAVVVGLVLRSIGLSPVVTCVFALTADVVDYGEWKSGLRTEGIINSGTSFGMKIGIGLGSALCGWILGFGGYDGAAAVQTVKALNSIKFGFSWFCVLLAVICLIVIFFMNLDKYMPQIQKELEEKHSI